VDQHEGEGGRIDDVVVLGIDALGINTLEIDVGVGRPVGAPRSRVYIL
jgi:hypothetical protein